MNGPLVLKLGGELIETAVARDAFAAMVAQLRATRPVAIVHGGGRAIDAELDRRGIAPRKVDGLRITDAPTRDAVVAVLAGSANTDLVAALVSAMVPAVGLTGVDAAMAESQKAPALRSTSGADVDLGLVGDPEEVDPALVELLMTSGYVPVVASLGIERGLHGVGILNVNADVMACCLAASLGAELVIAGTTAGVLDADGALISSLTTVEMDALIENGTATAGMIAKLRACRMALDEGVPSVRLVDGRGFSAGVDPCAAPGTTLTRTEETEAKVSVNS